MKALNTLPEGYGELISINVQKDKKLSLIINGLAILIAVAMVVPMLFIVPITTIYNQSLEIIPILIKAAVIIASIIAYIVLHELTHALAMFICGTRKVKFGIKGMFAYAGSNDYYGKGSYIFIALAPVVLFLIVLVIANVFVPLDWFWVVYLVQIMNVSGAVGDYYVTARFIRLPKDVLVQDSGVSMTVYSKTVQENK